MKKLLILALFIAISIPMNGQSFVEDVSSWAGGWADAFSASGRKNWKPEFTLRYSVGISSAGPIVTGGVRIDDKRTLGLMVGHASTYIDAAPGDIYHIQTGAYMRRYFHLGGRDITAFYSDLSIGCSWIYKVEGKYWCDPASGEIVKEMISDNPGDVWFLASWEPGIRFRFYKNIHLFFGPTIATDRLGLHLGIGF